MTPMAHYLRGFSYGGAVFFGGFFVFVFIAFAPLHNGSPLVLTWLTFLTQHGIPDWLAFPVLFFISFGISAFCAESTRWAYRRLVPAACPECGGQAYGEGRWPVLYVCVVCGHIHDTGIRECEET